MPWLSSSSAVKLRTPMLYTRGADLGGGDIYTATLGSSAINCCEHLLVSRDAGEVKIDGLGENVQH